MKDKRDDGDYTVTSEIVQCTEAISHTQWQLKCHGCNLEYALTIDKWQIQLHNKNLD